MVTSTISSINKLTADLPHSAELEYHNARGVHNLSTKMLDLARCEGGGERGNDEQENNRVETRNGGTYSALGIEVRKEGIEREGWEGKLEIDRWTRRKVVDHGDHRCHVSRYDGQGREEMFEGLTIRLIVR